MTPDRDYIAAMNVGIPPLGGPDPIPELTDAEMAEGDLTEELR